MRNVETISDGLAGRSDNFLLLRFIAATMVIYGHAPKVTGKIAPPDLFLWLNWGEYSGDIAVDIFFIVSGFLVTGSFFRRRNVVDFLWARIIRIFPALIVCLVLCAWVIGPYFTLIPRRIYFSIPLTYDYVFVNLEMQGTLFALPGVFASNPHLTMVNASIWTLPAEVRMYLWVAILGLIGLISRRWLFNLAFVGLMIYGYLYPHAIPLINAQDYVRLAGLFAIGAFCFINRTAIPNHAFVVILLVGLAWLYRNTDLYPYLFAMCEAAFVFWFAYRTPWYGFNRMGDYSYGIYLWGFFSQQMVAAVARDLSSLANALIGFAIALLFAFFSWHVIEKPALKLKAAPASLWRRSRSLFGSRSELEGA